MEKFKKQLGEIFADVPSCQLPRTRLAEGEGLTGFDPFASDSDDDPFGTVSDKALAKLRKAFVAQPNNAHIANAATTIR